MFSIVQSEMHDICVVIGSQSVILSEEELLAAVMLELISSYCPPKIRCSFVFLFFWSNRNETQTKQIHNRNLKQENYQNIAKKQAFNQCQKESDQQQALEPTPKEH